MKKGFTLIETLLVLGIGILLGTIVFLGIVKSNATQDLDLTTNGIVGFLRDAQQRAQGQQSNSAWGIRFDNPPSGGRDRYYLFSGYGFSGATATARFSNKVEFSDPAEGSVSDIVFDKITGQPTTSLSVTLYLVSDASETRTITINTNGSISY